MRRSGFELVWAGVLSAGLVWSGCASSPQRTCDGEVMGVGVNCHEVAAAAPSGQAHAREAGPSSQPSREPGPSSQPSTRSAPSTPATTPKPITKVEPKEPPPAPPPPTTVAAPTSEAVPPMVNVVYFKAERSDITVDAKVVLEQIVDYLKKSPNEKVTLKAFVDPTGQAKTNQRLLKERSQAVYQFLVDNGVTKAQVDLPANVAVPTPADFPSDQYWRLRKVAIEFSDHARALLEAREAARDQAAENDAKPEPKPKKEPTRTAALKPNTIRSKPDDIPDPAASSEKKLDKVDILYWKSVNHSLFIIAKAMGFFAEEGLDVRLHPAEGMEASEMSVLLAENNRGDIGKIGSEVYNTAQLRKRKYFLGAICPYGFHEELGKGIPLVQIGGMLAQPTTIVMKKELAASVRKNLEAFRGHSIARWKQLPTSIDYIRLFTSVLKKRNIAFVEKEYDTWAEMENAVVKGEVDAFPSTPPYDSAFIERHPELAVFEVRTLYPQMSCCRQVVTREQLKDKTTRDRYVRFERAMIKAHKYYREHLVETSELVAKVLDMKPAVVREIFLRPGYSLDPNPNSKGAVAFYKTLEDQIGKQDVKEAIDTSIYEEALFSLARENPKEEYFNRAVREYKLTN